MEVTAGRVPVIVLMEDLEYVEARTKDKHAAAKVLRDAAVETYETLGVGGFDRVRTPTVES